MRHSEPWELAAVKPAKSTAAIEVIIESMAARRAVIMVDEADRATPKLLDLLRDVNGMTGASIILIGEENLTGKQSLALERVLDPGLRAIALPPALGRALTGKQRTAKRMVKEFAVT